MPESKYPLGETLREMAELDESSRNIDPTHDYFVLFGEWDDMIGRFCKPGGEIVQGLSNRAFFDWAYMLARLVDQCDTLDAIKKIVVYQRKERTIADILKHQCEEMRDRLLGISPEQLQHRLETLTDEQAHDLHMVTGIVGEAGELVRAVLESVLFDKPLDRANVIEELGDSNWYQQGLMRAHDITHYDVMLANLTKLRMRYSLGKYSNEQAIERADKHAGDTTSDR